MEAKWIQIGSYSTGLEADIVQAQLESAGIPVLRQNDQAGVFGPSFQGAVPRAIRLSVPSPELERARELLEE
ncbi:MAG: DUF2007 domain-containing protein [Gemmatimonadales bacterium]|jgi:hypothetical protein